MPIDRRGRSWPDVFANIIMNYDFVICALNIGPAWPSNISEAIDRSLR